MVRKSAARSPDEETKRDSRLKLVLLALALVLVAGYALTITEMGAQTLHQVRAVFRSELSLLLIGGTGAAVAVGGLVYLFVRGRLRKVREPVPSVAEIAGRKEFLEALAREIEANAKSGRQLALHIIDIDRFRVINHVRGEPEGDDFLRLASERLLLIVNQPERLGRIGDDEFAILQPEVGGSRHAEIFARRIQESLKDACAQMPAHARPGASIGIAVAPDHGSDATGLLHSASLALGAAKKAGGDTFRVFSREMEMAVATRLKMEKAIGDGLQSGWFDLRFQPQYDLRTRRLTGFEALVRLNHPELGELLPAALLPVAEESRLIQPLGEWIIREAFATAVTWPQRVTLSINVSLAQFRLGDVATAIANASTKAGLACSRLRIEIPEAVLLERSEAVGEQLHRLRSRGATIVIDDFGVESSRLKLLSRSAIDAVKLDTSLVEPIGSGPAPRNLLRSLILLARSLDLDVSAEGVERAEQAHFLMSSNCHKVQGFLFGRPARKDDLPAIIAKDTRNAMERSDADRSHASATVAA